MLFEDVYLTIEETAESVFRDRGSRFIGLAVPVENEIAVKQTLGKIKKIYYDATHHCYAFRLGFDKSIFRFNDDGEPSGTAGRPIFGQIQSKDLTNVLVVVVRYFGGTKLGVSGLINAYKTTAREVLEKSKIIEKTINDSYHITFNYEKMNDVMRVLKDENAVFISQNFDEKCTVEFSVRKMKSGKVYEKLNLISGAVITYLKTF
ncbi:MAG: YigZ family protein [Bacteroidales bacterium]|jgi:uncharacterized YigZ family protein|nr:YigZ family protein [Bacteroidales bacterium]